MAGRMQRCIWRNSSEAGTCSRKARVPGGEMGEGGVAPSGSLWRAGVGEGFVCF